MQIVSEKSEPLTMSVKEAAKALGISRGLAYDLARQNKLPGVLRLGRRMVVSRKAINAFLDGGNLPPKMLT